MNELVLVPAFIGCALMLLVFGRYRGKEAAAAWREYWLPVEAEVEVAELEDQFARDRTLLLGLQGYAIAAREAGTDALPYVRTASAMIDGAAPDRIARLRRMADHARMTAAVMPVVPLDPAEFRLHEVRLLARLARALHHLLVGAPERLWLRCVALIGAVRLVARAVRTSDDRLKESPRREPLWTRFTRAIADWTQLDRQHIVTLRSLMHLIIESGRR